MLQSLVLPTFAAAARSRKIPISRRALIRRINRRLRKDALRLKISRPNSRALAELGEYYHVDDRNHVTGPDVPDIEAYARAIGALQDFEVLK